ncbi:hypothetical protein [Streptomyces sp. NPDC060333]|uniref:hypothetical protein n=1 Tax=Streptomyces sp. NPDC060333 TaxID=3347098 RepID=UPI00364F41D6
MMISRSALTAAVGGHPSIAASRPAAASSTNGSYNAANVTDGNQCTYWESAGGTFP